MKRTFGKVFCFSPARLLGHAAVFALLTLIGYSAAFIAIILRLREESTQNDLSQTIPGHVPTSAWERFASIHQHASDLAYRRYPEHWWQDPHPWTVSWFLLFFLFALAMAASFAMQIRSARTAFNELSPYTKNRAVACVRRSWIEATQWSRWLVLAPLVLGFSVGLFGEATSTLRTHVSSVAAWKAGNPAAIQVPTSTLGLFDTPELLMLLAGITFMIRIAASNWRGGASLHSNRLARRICASCGYPNARPSASDHPCPECGGSGTVQTAKPRFAARWAVLLALLATSLAAYALIPYFLYSK